MPVFTVLSASPSCIMRLSGEKSSKTAHVIHEHELGPLLKEAEVGGVRILWVQLRACVFEETLLSDYQAVVSPPEKPLAQWRREDRDEAWARVCKEIKSAVDSVPAHGILPLGEA